MWTVLLWIGAIVVGVPVLYLIGMVVMTIVAGGKPKGVEIEVSAPATCRIGDEFTVEVRIGDTLGRSRRLRSVDVSATYLKGIVVQSVEPKPTDQNSSPTLGEFIFPMDRTIAPSGTEVVRFRCKAATAGDYSGDVTVYVDSKSFKFITHPVRTVVS